MTVSFSSHSLLSLFISKIKVKYVGVRTYREDMKGYIAIGMDKNMGILGPVMCISFPLSLNLLKICFAYEYLNHTLNVVISV